MKYMKLDQKGNAMAEYIWIDSTGGVRSKSRVRNFFAFLIFCAKLPWFLLLDPLVSLPKARLKPAWGPLPQAHVRGSPYLSHPRKWSIMCGKPRNFEGYRAWPTGLLWLIVMVSPASLKRG